ncbi:hypothetical protein QO004_003686 [Rhizobium mesoamericanum]|nr:hypothetical protein [Rhizobium mesoamericanum]
MGAKAENRRRATYQAKLTRSLKSKGKKQSKPEIDSDDASSSTLLGWEEFGRNRLLR